MIRPFLFAALMLVFITSFASNGQAQASEKDAVRVPLENYIKAHATGDPEFARKAFHTEGNLIWIRDGKYSLESFVSFKKRAFYGKTAAADEKRKDQIKI